MVFVLLALALPAWAGTAAEQAENTAALMRGLLEQQVQSDSGHRVELEIGEINPRLKLASCRKLAPYLLPGTRLWGRTRVGLRCVDGPVAWNVYLPVTVKVYGAALVASRQLAAGHELAPGDLQMAEVDLAAENAPVIADHDDVMGRVLLRAMAPGDALRQNSLRKHRWFAAGDMVEILARGDGFAASSRGRAITPGVEGRAVRVRMDNGRIVTGQPVGERLVEILL